jgi:hypothetical protein
MEQRKSHPIADIFPILTKEETNDLADDIVLHGQREPIWMYEGKILAERTSIAARTASPLCSDVLPLYHYANRPALNRRYGKGGFSCVATLSPRSRFCRGERG